MRFQKDKYEWVDGQYWTRNYSVFTKKFSIGFHIATAPSGLFINISVSPWK